MVADPMRAVRVVAPAVGLTAAAIAQRPLRGPLHVARVQARQPSASAPDCIGDLATMRLPQHLIAGRRGMGAWMVMEQLL